MYRVVKKFQDLKDDGYIYEAGDKYPRTGKRPGKARIAELASTDNKRHEVLIEKVEEVEE